MQKSLAVKSQELRAKNEAANAKLRQMVKDQNEAEQKKIQSQEIQAMLVRQTEEIAIKKKDVMGELDQVMMPSPFRSRFVPALAAVLPSFT